jgi:hypothetical protein
MRRQAATWGSQKARKKLEMEMEAKEVELNHANLILPRCAFTVGIGELNLALLLRRRSGQ